MNICGGRRLIAEPHRAWAVCGWPSVRHGWLGPLQPTSQLEHHSVIGRGQPVGLAKRVGGTVITSRGKIVQSPHQEGGSRTHRHYILLLPGTDWLLWLTTPPLLFQFVDDQFVAATDAALHSPRATRVGAGLLDGGGTSVPFWRSSKIQKTHYIQVMNWFACH